MTTKRAPALSPPVDASMERDEREVALEALRSSEARLRELLAATTDYTYTVRIEDGAAADTIHSPTCEAVTGYRPGEFSENPYLWSDMVPEPDRAAIRDQCDAVLRGETPPPVEHRLIRKDGREIWVRSVLIPHFAADGRLREYTGILSDITARKQAEGQTEKYRDVLEATYDLATTDRDRSLEEICAHAARQLADFLEVPFVTIRDRRDGVYRLLARVVPDDAPYPETDSQTAPCRICQSMERNAVPVRILGPMEDSFPGAACATYTDCSRSYAGVPVLDSQGRMSGIVCALDTTETPFEDQDLRVMEIFARHIAFELELEQQREALRRKEQSEMLGQIASAVAHEVRNPLNGIMVTLEVLKQHLNKREDLGKYFDRIERQSRKMNGLMRDLLEMRKPVESRRFVRVRLREYLGKQITLWRQEHAEYSERIAFSPDPDGDDPAVKLDADRFGLAFGNLLSNACEQSPSDAPVRVAVGRDREMARIEVIDRGTGIPDEHISRVFDPFFTTRKKGHGLGLNIVRHIVDNHAGRIDVRNNTSEPGCTFRIHLPTAE